MFELGVNTWDVRGGLLSLKRLVLCLSLKASLMPHLDSALAALAALAALCFAVLCSVFRSEAVPLDLAVEPLGTSNFAS